MPRKIQARHVPITSIIDPQTGLELRVEMVRMTPKLASDIIEKTAINQRGLNVRTVELYASQMKKGTWAGGNGETIKISSDGNLIDGQHRLSAVISAATTVDLIVVTGVHEDNIRTLDDGKTRSFRDVLLVNEANDTELTAGQVAGVVKGMLKVKHLLIDGVDSSTVNRTRVSNTELLLLLQQNPVLVETMNDYVSVFDFSEVSKSIGRAAPIILWYVFKGTRQEREIYDLLKTFETGLPQNKVLGKSSASYVLMRALNNVRDPRSHPVLYTVDYLLLCLWAIERDILGAKLTKCYITTVCKRDLRNTKFISHFTQKISQLK